MFILMFYALIPYLIVLQNLTLADAISKAPRILRKNFGKLLPLTLFAMFCMFMVSFSKTLPSPYSYAVPLIASAVIGTYLIIELMRVLQESLLADNEIIPQLNSKEVRTSRAYELIHIILVPVLIAVSVLFASGQYLTMFDWGKKKQLDGLSYLSSFSSVFYSSEQQYISYEWLTEEYQINAKLPNLSDKQKPESISGIADITWFVDKEVRTVNGNHTYVNRKPFLEENKLMYRLVRETAQDGSYYYSSLNGSASIIRGREDYYEAQSIQVMVSGDGKSIFVLRYPARFDISQVFRVSSDGRYLIPRTSQVNPHEFRTYWFGENLQVDDVFELISAKNQMITIPTFDQIYEALAVALQEADGEMVIEILERIRSNDINVKAPDWDEQEWTIYLRKLYKDTSLQQTLQFVTKAGLQNSYLSTELTKQVNEETTSYQLEVPFPNENIVIDFEMEKEGGRMLSISLLN
ncbi:MAG TPA: hypothetical protein IAA29_15060 [Candidatus Paenibacillus intestinavium]|nr:hypothetical protein [Candidatus Paenibacillus intestinavium]